MSDFKQAQPTIARPTPVDRAIEWDKSKVLISETDANGTITNVNSVFSEVSGYSTEELIGAGRKNAEQLAPYLNSNLHACGW